MAATHLSPEIVSLIHHVELNESGWWKKASGQVVKGVLWKASTPLTVTELQSALKREVGISLSDEALKKQIDVLINQQAVTAMPTRLENEEQLRVKSQEAAAAHTGLIRLRYAVSLFGFSFVLGVGLSIAAYLSLPTPLTPIQMWTTVFAAGLIPFAVACVASTYFTRKHDSLQNWWPARATDWIGKKAIIAPLVLGAGAIYQGGVWDWFKSLISWNP